MSSFRATARLLSTLAVLGIVAACVAPATGEEKPNPIVTRVKDSVKDPAKPFTLIVTLKLKDGAAEKFEAAFLKAAKPTRKEKGCLVYELSRDAKTPTQYVVYEHWQNLPALEAHLKTPHITTLFKELSDLLAGEPESRVLIPVKE
jgi:quinol monooxygenase YgiN